MRYFDVRGLRDSLHTGDVDGTRRWMLPGVRCPRCKAVWGTAGLIYPSVDLSQHPERKNLEEARLEEDFIEFERLRESVRHLIPGQVLLPGTGFGSFQGSAQGRFGPLVFPTSWIMMVRREALEQLQAEGLQGLKGCRVDLRFRQKKNPPELVELELLPLALLHEDCIPPENREPCPRCGRWGFSLPGQPILKASTLPKGVDLFRLADLPTIIVATERFVEAVRKVWPEESLELRELPVR
ncbi:MAG TPA: double-CXXCG motif protein [Hyalangium sp.]|nr:double-CXXCG motif protein [Hyalangium sp.]